MYWVIIGASVFFLKKKLYIKEIFYQRYNSATPSFNYRKMEGNKVFIKVGANDFEDQRMSEPTN